MLKLPVFGWTRIQVTVDDIAREVARHQEAGRTFRNAIVKGRRRLAGTAPRPFRQPRRAVPAGLVSVIASWSSPLWAVRRSRRPRASR
jgi:hypothetical protein